MSTFAEALGAYLRSFKEGQPLSLGELSRRAGGEISVAYLSRLLRGEKHEPSFRVVLFLARGLELDQYSRSYRHFFRSAGYYVPPPPWECLEACKRGEADKI